LIYNISTTIIIIFLICHTHDERIEYAIMSLESMRDMVQGIPLRRKRAEKFRRLSTRPAGDVANEKHANSIASVDNNKVDKIFIGSLTINHYC